jgi:dihydroorotate dehydrogenase
VEDAWEKVTAGASLLQMYSALVFQGPAIVGQIVEELRRRSAGAPWQDVVGSASGRT